MIKRSHWRLILCLTIFPLVAYTSGCTQQNRNTESFGDTTPTPVDQKRGDFTGEILPVFYVSDVSASVEFYRDVLAFEFHHFWDYGKSEEVREWESAAPPTYAEMAAGDQKFALHFASEPYERQVGGVIHYFRVQDVGEYYHAVIERGGKPSALLDRPWMHMFSITDPDGHKLFFFTPPEEDQQ